MKKYIYKKNSSWVVHLNEKPVFCAQMKAFLSRIPNHFGDEAKKRQNLSADWDGSKDGFATNYNSAR